MLHTRSCCMTQSHAALEQKHDNAQVAGALQSRARPPVTQQRTPHVDALVDSGCNQHLFKDLSLFVTVDRSRVVQPFTVASDRTTTPQGYGTARFGVTDETGYQLTVTLPGCYLDETLPFNLLSVSQLLEAGAISNPDFTRRELHFLDCPDFMDANPRPRTVPMNSEGGLYSLRLNPRPRLVAQANSGGPPPPGTKLKEPMQVLAGVAACAIVCAQIRRTLRERTRRFQHGPVY
jgi:hypothetical protein